MSIDSITPLFISAIGAAIPLLFAALGELIAEKAGVLNLGLEGTILMGALSSFLAVTEGSPLFLALLIGVAVSVLFTFLFAFVTVSLQANQVATGLSLTILGVGLSAVVGKTYVGFTAAKSFSPAPIPFLKDIPLLGPSLFSLDYVAYFCIFSVIAIAWFLSKSKAGLALRAVGESPAVARSLGLPVTKIRYLAVLFGGGFAGLAGVYYALAQFKIWQDGLTSGNGWIALALVVFGTWRPFKVALGALLFGSVTVLGLYFQVVGIKISAFVLAGFPYVTTILILVYLSMDKETIRRHAPAWLGKPFFDDR